MKKKQVSHLPPIKKLNLTRRHFMEATSALVGAGILSSYGLPIYAASNVDEMMKMYNNANIDWQSQKGSSIVLSGLEHPWMSSIEPLLPHFKTLTGIDVQVQKQSESEYVAEVPIKLGAGSPSPDVYMVWSYGQAANAGWLESLDQHFDNSDLFDKNWYDLGDIFSSAKSFPVWNDGQSYVMSITAEAQTMFANQNMLDAIGAAVPTTFDELLSTGKKLKTGDVSGVAMRSKADGSAGTWPCGGFVFSNGGVIIQDGKCMLDSAEAIQAVHYYGTILNEAGPLGVGNYHWYECLNDYMQEVCAIGLDSSNFATDIENPEKSNAAGHTTYGAMVSGPGQQAKPNMWHWMAGINSKSEQKSAAFLFLTWANSKPTCLMSSALGLATTRTSAWESDGFKSAFGSQAATAALTNLQNADGKIMKDCWFHPQSGEILTPFGIAINEVVTGTKSAENAMKEATAKINKAIGA